MSIYLLPHGQYGYKGHVTNMPQDITTTLVSSLPRLPSELDLVIVRKECSQNSHRDFRVKSQDDVSTLCFTVVADTLKLVQVVTSALAKTSVERTSLMLLE